jgi:hypothetical protein
MCPVSWPIHLHTALGGVAQRLLYLSNRDVEIFSSGFIHTNQKSSLCVSWAKCFCVVVPPLSFDESSALIPVTAV